MASGLIGNPEATLFSTLMTLKTYNFPSFGSHVHSLI